VLYVTGEESGAQVALRARRLGLDGARVRVLAEIKLEKHPVDAAAPKPGLLRHRLDPDAVLRAADLGARQVAQVRECAAQLTRHAKSRRLQPWCWSATSPRTARWPARACWSTSSTRCCTSKATRTAASAWCAPSRTASAP
jgi:hypothetical protein